MITRDFTGINLIYSSSGVNVLEMRNLEPFLNNQK